MKPEERLSSVIQEPEPFRLHPVTLQFRTPKLELRYKISYAKRSLFIARLAMVLGGIQYLLFAFLDLMLGSIITREMFINLLLIRFSVFLVIMMVFGWSFHKSFKKYMQPGISIVPFVAGLGVALMILILQSDEGYNQYYVGFIIIFIYIHVLLKLRFIYATAVSWLIFFLFTFASLHIQAETLLFINSSFFLISAQLCGMVASYLLEFYDRTVFRQKIVLDDRQRQLKQQVTRKTDELNDMRSIQHTLLPEQPPCYPGFEIAAAMKTASEVGGDYYDFQLSKNGVLTFVIADATGHGAKAGLMVMAAKILFTLLGRNKCLPDTLTRFSKIIKSTGLKQLYLSMALGRLNKNQVELAGAGMPSAMHWSAKEKQIAEIPLKGMPLGSVTSYPYSSTVITMEAGDLLLLVSDGLPELANNNGKMLGYDAPKNLLAMFADQNANEIINSLEKTISHFCNGVALKDDVSIIAIKRK